MARVTQYRDGQAAFRAGEPFDETRSEHWRAGWRAACEAGEPPDETLPGGWPDGGDARAEHAAGIAAYAAGEPPPDGAARRAGWEQAHEAAAGALALEARRTLCERVLTEAIRATFAPEVIVPDAESLDVVAADALDGLVAERFERALLGETEADIAAAVRPVGLGCLWARYVGGPIPYRLAGASDDAVEAWVERRLAERAETAGLVVHLDHDARARLLDIVALASSRARARGQIGDTTPERAAEHAVRALHARLGLPARALPPGRYLLVDPARLVPEPDAGAASVSGAEAVVSRASVVLDTGADGGVECIACAPAIAGRSHRDGVAVLAFGVDTGRGVIVERAQLAHLPFEPRSSPAGRWVALDAPEGATVYVRREVDGLVTSIEVHVPGGTVTQHGP